jgi:hypothetical protein
LRPFVFSSAVFVACCGVLLQLHTQAQTIDPLLPTGIPGNPLSDTLLNKNSILAKAGVKQIFAIATSPGPGKNLISKTAYINKAGNIQLLQICFPRNGEDTTLCTYDTLIYDDKDRLVNLEAVDAKGNFYFKQTVDYTGKNEEKYISKSGEGNNPVTTTRYFNDKGQLVRQIEVISGKNPQQNSALIYYNADGLPDSVRHTRHTTTDGVVMVSPTTVDVFKRTKKKKEIGVEMENDQALFKWVYNAAGQCLSAGIVTKFRPGMPLTHGKSADLTTKSVILYNPDGTLAKIITEYSDKAPITVTYLYSHYDRPLPATLNH